MRSVLAQTYTNIRVIVADNASTDGSRAICDDIDDPRLEFRHDSVLLPVSKNWNRALSYADTDYVALLHADDTWRPDFLEVMLERLATAPDADAAVCASGLIDESGAALDRADRPTMEHARRSGMLDQRAYEDLLLGMYVRPCAWVARRPLFARVEFDGRFDRAPDWDFWLKVASRPRSIVFEPSVLCDYRLHSSNDTFTEACLAGIRRDEIILLEEALARRPVGSAVEARARARLDMRSVVHILQVLLLGRPALAWRLLRQLLHTKGLVGLGRGLVQLVLLDETWRAARRSLRAMKARPSRVRP